MRVYHELFRYNLSPNALKVFIFINQCQNCLRTSTIKIATIMSACAIAERRTATRAIAELKEKELLLSYRRRNNAGDYICNGYITKQLSGKYLVLSSVLKSLQLPKSSFATYLYLLKCRDQRKKSAYPSITHIAGILKASRNTIIAALKDLVDRLLIAVAPKRPGKHNLYFLLQNAISYVFGKKKKDNAFRSSHCPSNTEPTSKNFCTTILRKAVDFVKQKAASLIFFIRGSTKNTLSVSKPAVTIQKRRG